MQLISIHFSRDLNDLRKTPANRLELLKGDQEGQYSVRINDQRRICFRWEEGFAYDNDRSRSDSVDILKF